MKRFDFNLEPVLRWRKAIADLRNSEALVCMRAVADAERELARVNAEHAEVRRQIAEQSNGAALAACAAYIEHSRRIIEDARRQLKKTQAALKLAMEKLVEADRNARLLEKMKSARLSEWNAESEREIEGFAAEAFLNRRT